MATYFLRVQIIVLKRGKRSYTESHPFLLEEFTELFLSTGLEKSLEEHHDNMTKADSFRSQPLLEELTLLGLGLIKIHTVSDDFNNPRLLLVSNN